MKLRLLSPGMERYTAQMGTVFFEDGVSTTDVSHKDATRIAAVYACEWEDGTNPSVSQFLLDHMNTPAVSVQTTTVATTTPAPVAPVVAPAQTEKVVWNETDLAKIADEKGIAGLREIAEPMGLKGNSIRMLIEAVVKATGGTFEDQGE
ncbi:hypothetical protein [Paraburkholderia sp.]|uniref:hypothetical protein n=1 Tax=Paraburkholderia sp. TaxID=1926495 RepID=UPI0039E4D72C